MHESVGQQVHIISSGMTADTYPDVRLSSGQPRRDIFSSGRPPHSQLRLLSLLNQNPQITDEEIAQELGLKSAKDAEKLRLRLKKNKERYIGLENTLLKLVSFVLSHPEVVDKISFKDDDAEDFRVEQVKQYLKDYMEATKDVCCYCAKGKVIHDNGDRVCQDCGAVQPENTIRLPTLFYRQVQNFGVWNKNLGMDPMQVFKTVQRKLLIKNGIMIRNPTDPRFLGDPEDLVLRNLLGYFTWLCTHAGFPPYVISSAAKIIRKHHRKRMKELLNLEKRQAFSLLVKIETMKHGGITNREQILTATKRLFNDGDSNDLELEDEDLGDRFEIPEGLHSPSVGYPPHELSLIARGK